MDWDYQEFCSEPGKGRQGRSGLPRPKVTAAELSQEQEASDQRLCQAWWVEERGRLPFPGAAPLAPGQAQSRRRTGPLWRRRCGRGGLPSELCAPGPTTTS